MADFTKVEQFALAGHDRSARLPTTHLRPKPRAALGIYTLATSLLRVLVRLLYLFPILILVKIVLFAMHKPASDGITLAFVGLVVALFGMFAFVMLLIAILGPRSTRGATGELVFRAPRDSEADNIIARVVSRTPIRVVGRVDAGLDPGATVLEESWSEKDGKMVRSVEASSFVVFPDEGAPVVVEIAACPILIARYEHDETSLARFVLKQGDRVEVAAKTSHPGTHVALQKIDEAKPYREAESTAMAITSSDDTPLVIRAL